MQSINQNMNVLQPCDKSSTGVKVSVIHDNFAQKAPSHFAAIHNYKYQNYK